MENVIREFIRAHSKRAREVWKQLNRTQNTKVLREFIKIRSRKATEVARGLNKNRRIKNE